MREYTFNVLPEYDIIFRLDSGIPPSLVFVLEKEKKKNLYINGNDL